MIPLLFRNQTARESILLGQLKKETFTSSDAGLLQDFVSKLVGTVKVKSSLEEITSATQFKSRSALLFLFIVLQKCVYFVFSKTAGMGISVWNGKS